MLSCAVPDSPGFSSSAATQVNISLRVQEDEAVNPLLRFAQSRFGFFTGELRDGAAVLEEAHAR